MRHLPLFAGAGLVFDRRFDERLISIVASAIFSMTELSLPGRSDDPALGVDLDLLAGIPGLADTPLAQQPSLRSGRSSVRRCRSSNPGDWQSWRSSRPGRLSALPDAASARSELRGPEYRLKTSAIQLLPVPEPPVPVGLVDQVRRQHKLPAELSLLDPKLCQTLSEAFSDHPWIARVISVQKTHPAAVIVRVEFRRPVAMIQVRGGRVPIDSTGTVLPSEDFGVADVAEYPTIRLIGSSSLTQQGGRFKEPGLPGAVQIAELLRSKWNSLGLEAIELPRKSDSADESGDIQFRIMTKVGSTILWGRAPGTDHPGELTAAQKIARLEKYLAEFGGFDRPSGPYEIDIRHWQEITRRPTARHRARRRYDATAGSVKRTIHRSIASRGGTVQVTAAFPAAFGSCAFPMLAPLRSAGREESRQTRRACSCNAEGAR